MIKVKNILDEILFEKKEEGLKIFYNIKAFIQAFQDDIEKIDNKEVEKEPASEKEKEETGDQEPQETLPPNLGNPEELNQSYEIKGNVLNEDIIEVDRVGDIQVPREDVDQIRSIDDLLFFLQKQKKAVKITDNIQAKPKHLVHKVVIEIVLALINKDERALKELIHKGDKLFVDVDYGKELESSVGISVLKNPGTLSISLNMKKDGKIIPMQFDKVLFNKNLIDLRNELFG